LQTTQRCVNNRARSTAADRPGPPGAATVDAIARCSVQSLAWMRPQRCLLSVANRDTTQRNASSNSGRITRPPPSAAAAATVTAAFVATGFDVCSQCSQAVDADLM